MSFRRYGYPTVVVGEDFPRLQAGVAYRYRLVARSDAPGDPVVDGAEQTLIVPGGGGSAAEPACANEVFRTGLSSGLPDCRAYEQVTPPEKNGTQDVFNYDTLFASSYTAENGESVFLRAPGVQWGPVPTPSEYLFSRTSAGWQTKSATPQPQAGVNSYRGSLFSPDLSQVGLEVGWQGGNASSSPEVEFKLGPAGGPYTTVGVDTQERYFSVDRGVRG